MKRIILMAISFILLASVSWAAPFLVCDPQTGVTLYKLTGPAWVPATKVAEADGSLKLDVSGATIGSNSLTVSACWTIAPWGEQCSTSVPFVFTRPASPITPTNTRLTP